MNTTDPSLPSYAYLAGPMRGYPLYNFEQFMGAAAILEHRGIKVLNPAQMDLEIGFDPLTDPFDDIAMHSAMRRDINALLQVDAIILLPKWRESEGARFELGVARMIGLDIFEYHNGFLTGVDEYDLRGVA